MAGAVAVRARRAAGGRGRERVASDDRAPRAQHRRVPLRPPGAAARARAPPRAARGGRRGNRARGARRDPRDRGRARGGDGVSRGTRGRSVAGPSDGRVRVTSPYRIRARRVRHLFVASLQEGEFPRHDPGEPLLSDDAGGAGPAGPRRPGGRGALPVLRLPLAPHRRLYLCWRSCDDEGAPPPSPLLDDVRDLLELRRPRTPASQTRWTTRSGAARSPMSP